MGRYALPVLPGGTVGIHVDDVLGPSWLGENPGGIELEPTLLGLQIEAPIGSDAEFLPENAPKHPAALAAVQNVGLAVGVVLAQEIPPQIQLCWQVRVVDLLNHCSMMSRV
jgi:hypothetical protein